MHIINAVFSEIISFSKYNLQLSAIKVCIHFWGHSVFEVEKQNIHKSVGSSLSLDLEILAQFFFLYVFPIFL